MSNYKEVAVTGTKWQRCNSVTINNPLGAIPTVSMGEQIMAVVDGDTFAQTAQGLNFAFDPGEVIALRNPATNELVGSTMTGLDVYVALYSLYIQKAQERDATL